MIRGLLLAALLATTCEPEPPSVRACPYLAREGCHWRLSTHVRFGECIQMCPAQTVAGWEVVEVRERKQ